MNVQASEQIVCANAAAANLDGPSRVPNSSDNSSNSKELQRRWTVRMGYRH